MKFIVKMEELNRVNKMLNHSHILSSKVISHEVVIQGEVLECEHQFSWFEINYGHRQFKIEKCKKCSLIKEKTSEPKKLAPALYKEMDFRSGVEGKFWYTTQALYSCLEEAKKGLKFYREVIWPAIPNAQGFYEIKE